MYNIKPLEEDWKKYQNKKKKPYYIALLIIILVVILFLFFNKRNEVFDVYMNKLDNISVDTSDFESIPSESVTLVNQGLVRLETLNIPIKKSLDAVDKLNEVLVDIPVLDLKQESNI